MYRPGKTRFCIYLTNDEEILIAYAMKVTGLDKTSTIRLLLRTGVLEMLAVHGGRAKPKLPPHVEDFLDSF